MLYLNPESRISLLLDVERWDWDGALGHDRGEETELPVLAEAYA